MSRFVLTSRAGQDLGEIEDHIAQDDPDVARFVLEELQAAMRRLARLPRIGHRRANIQEPERYRFWPVFSYLIVCAPETKPPQIIRVIHGHRDVPEAVK